MFKYLVISLLFFQSFLWAGASRNFDGTDDRVEMDDADDLDLTGGVYTLSAWINMDSFGDSDNGRILDKDGASGANSWAFFVNDAGDIDSISLWVNDATAANADSDVIVVNTWHHVAVAVSGGSGTFYVDGVASGTFSGLQNPGAGTTVVSIGIRPDLFREFDGDMAYNQIWDRQLNTGEINEILHNPSILVENLIGYWTLWGASSEFDYSGLGHTGTPTGSTEIFDGPPVFFLGVGS